MTAVYLGVFMERSDVQSNEKPVSTFFLHEGQNWGLQYPQ